jgi:deoxyhypusine synthase
MEVPEVALNAVLLKSENHLKDAEIVKGYDFNNGIDYEEMLKSFKNCGFQATNFGLAVEEINKMLVKRDTPLNDDDLDEYEDDEFIKRKHHCTIFLGYTSNIVSSGLRETLRYLVQNKLVDCVVTTAGGVEEDFIKCMAPTYIGSFELPGKELRSKGINRIGNLLVPNDNYCKFENWIMPIFDEMLEEQKEKGTLWTPSRMIARLGEKIDSEESIYYWAARNQIPVFCPALTDGSLGDMLYFHSFRKPGLVLDILEDVRRINKIAAKAKESGILSIGAGVSKHHIMKANCIRDGAEYCVFLNTALEYDGSDSGANPGESVAAGKIKTDATPVKIHGEASLTLNLLVAQTFAKFMIKSRA